jgi:hypothetical protein
MLLNYFKRLTIGSLVIIFSVTASLTSISLLINSSVSALSGSDWQAGLIVDDSIFTNTSIMTVSDIQNFLNAKVPVCDTAGSQIYSGTTTRAQYSASKGENTTFTCLENYYENPTTHANNLDGAAIPAGAISAAQIIYNAGVQYGINPEVILVLLQKEQGLVLDNWPWDSEYTEATGYACPDSSGCNSAYAGFDNQVNNAAWQFRQYLNNPSNYNYLPGAANNVAYNPSTSCGSSNVTILSSSTAALYDYTPYQPDTAALSNLYGTGDSCSSYGNRNFWTYFNNWFGSTVGGVGLIKGTSTNTVYAFYNGEKQGIPTPDVLSAWGLGSLPIATLDDASLAAIPSMPTLTRVVQNPYNSSLYLLADNGGTFDALPNMVTDWGYNPSTAPPIGTDLVAYTTRLGTLSDFVTSPGVNGVFMIDGGSSRLFSNPANLASWAGSTPTVSISSSLLGDLTPGSGIFSNQAQTASAQYVLDSGKILSLNANLSTMYPRNSLATISTALANILPSGGSASQFVMGTTGTIYLVDGGAKHGIASLGLLASYTPSGSANITSFSNAELAEIPDGQTILTRFAYNSSNPTQQYYVNNGTYTLTAPFNDSQYGFAISPAGISVLGTSNGTASCSQGFVQAVGSPGIYILDNGVKRGIASLNMLGMLQNNTSNVCELAPADVNAIPTGSPISQYVSGGGVNYLVDGKYAYTVSGTVATSIGATAFTPVSSQFLANYILNGSMTTSFMVGNNYIFTDGGNYYSTTSSTIAQLWGMTGQLASHSTYFLSTLNYNGALTQFARPSDPTNGEILLVDSGKFLPISTLNDLFNAGYVNQNIPTVNISYINANLGSVWQGYLAQDATSGTVYVLDSGQKHAISSSLLPTWLGTTSPITPTVLSTNFLSLLSIGVPTTNSITTGAPGIYGINNGQIAGIPNLKTYLGLYSPSFTVSIKLIDSIPYGAPIPSL